MCLLCTIYENVESQVTVQNQKTRLQHKEEAANSHQDVRSKATVDESLHVSQPLYNKSSLKEWNKQSTGYTDQFWEREKHTGLIFQH